MTAIVVLLIINVVNIQVMLIAAWNMCVIYNLYILLDAFWIYSLNIITIDVIIKINYYCQIKIQRL